MIYDLNMPRDEFDRVDTIVRDVTRKCKPRTLVQITHDMTQLAEEEREYVERNPAALGVTFLDREMNEFSVWITPHYQHWFSMHALDTLMHELTHGYAGAMDHGQRFRRLLLQSIYRYDREVGPIFADNLAQQLLTRYSKDDDRTRDLELDFCKKQALGGLFA